MAAYHKILAAIDLSPASNEVLARASELAVQNGAELHVIHVTESVMVDSAYDGMPSVYVDVEQQIEQYAKEGMVKFCERFQVPLEHRWLASGSTKTEIFRVVEEQKIDLVVIGSHGRHGVELLLGSTANSILHGAVCDVLAVRIR